MSEKQTNKTSKSNKKKNSQVDGIWILVLFAFLLMGIIAIGLFIE
ncbi:MAG: hypothetical protein AB7W47_09805 [Calditrichaceae bacterium]